MSRNPYLAASRPFSSYTRSSRASSRSSGFGGSGLLGRSRSSATLGNLSSHLGSTTASSYNSSYVPSSSWQRSSSSTRPVQVRSSSSTRPQKDNDYESSTRVSSESGQLSDVSSRNNDSTDRSSLLRSTSSHNLGGSRDDEETSHLKNYQQSKIQQQQQTTSLASERDRASLKSLDSDTNYTKSQSTISLDSSASVHVSRDDDEPKTGDGDSIPSGSARHLKSQTQGLIKSKSLDISRQQDSEGLVSEPPLLSSSMSVDRLLSRMESMGEKDLRKSFKELVMENERLKSQLLSFDDKEKQKQQDWIRTERQLKRKISELEEENRQIEQWKLEIQRLKDENSSLIRVVSKLTKQH